MRKPPENGSLGPVSFFLLETWLNVGWSTVDLKVLVESTHTRKEFLSFLCHSLSYYFSSLVFK